MTKKGTFFGPQNVTKSRRAKTGLLSTHLCEKICEPSAGTSAFQSSCLIRFFCLYQLQNRASERHRPNQRKKKCTEPIACELSSSWIARTMWAEDLKKHIWADSERLQRRPAHAKPDFNGLSGPRHGTWKRTCGISCLPSLAPMWRFVMQQHSGNIHQSFATPRYSATPCYVLIQLPNVIDTISKRWRSKKAFKSLQTSPAHIFS